MSRPCPIGTMRLPITAETSTVLGLRVRADGNIWRGLDWTDMRIDGAPAKGVHGRYLSPAFAPPGEAHLDYWHGVRYRVRCRYQIGGRLHIGNRYACVLSVEAEQGTEGWCWVIGYGAKGGGE